MYILSSHHVIEFNCVDLFDTSTGCAYKKMILLWPIYTVVFLLTYMYVWDV